MSVLPASPVPAALAPRQGRKCREVGVGKVPSETGEGTGGDRSGSRVARGGAGSAKGLVPPQQN